MKQKLTAFLQTYPLYVLLLPLFFVLHGYNENFGFVEGKDILLLVLIYGGTAVALYGLFWLFYRNRIKASLLTIYALSFYLFFGAIKDFLRLHLRAADKYI